MHSFCESAQAEIGSNSVDISLTDLDTDVIDIEVNKRDKVLNPAQIKYLLLSNNSFNISNKKYFVNFTYDVKVYLIKLSFENIRKFINYIFRKMYGKYLGNPFITNLVLFFKKF
jgi:hypothetical protein